MKRFIGFLAIGALTACNQPASIGTVQQDIVNGMPDTGDPAVVAILAGKSGSTMGSLCTGEIISPHVVLTAAHCVDPATTMMANLFEVFIGNVLSQQSPMTDFLAVQTTAFDTAFDPNNPQNGHDVGVVILSQPTTITPILYNRNPIPQTMVGQAARLVGFGITDFSDMTGATAGTRRVAPSMLADVTSDGLLVGLQDGTHGICEGDSGGPAFVTFGSTEKIAGITSFGFDMCPLTVPAGTPPGYAAGNDTRVDTYTSFIDKYVTMYDPPAKGPGQPCTSNSDCLPLECASTSVGKICEQSCDPAMAASCPAGATCMDVDGSNICVVPQANGGSGGSGGGKGGGCAVAGSAPVGGLGLLFAMVALVALRRRARA